MLVSGKEEPEALLSPAMDAALRVFKRISGLPDNERDAKAAGAAFCSIRLLVAYTQAINLIGKQGSVIKSLQESTGASVRVLPAGLFWTLENIILIHKTSLGSLSCLVKLLGDRTLNR